MSLDYVPTLETERLILKAPTTEHTDSWEANFAQYHIIKNLTKATPWPYPKGGAMDFFKSSVEPMQGNNSWLWGIFLKKDTNLSNMAGCLDIRLKGQNHIVGYWLAQELWGNGYMSEAAHSIYDLVFTKSDIKYLTINNALKNPGSGNISKKAGAKLIETVETDKYVDPEFTMGQKWHLTREDWEANKKLKNITQPLYKIIE